MSNNLQKYNAQQEFSVEKIYQKLTQGIDKLNPEEAVDGLLTGVDCLRKGIAQIVERIYEGAEEKQSVVVQNKTEQWARVTDHVKDAIENATANSDYESVEKRLQDATKATIAAKESVSKMKYIKQRGRNYNAINDLVEPIKELGERPGRDYQRQQILEGEIIQ